MPERTEIMPLDPLAFFMALIGAPILVTACTFWLLFVPVFALIIGGLPYLLFGTPVLLALALTGPINTSRAALAAIGTVLGLLLLVQLWGFLHPGSRVVGTWRFALLCGLVFGPIWAGAFSWLYNCFYHNPAI